MTIVEALSDFTISTAHACAIVIMLVAGIPCLMVARQLFVKQFVWRRRP